MARKRKGNAINGVILLDKPTSISSNDLLQKVKRLYNAQKAGHTGALDPLATGMLPICFGESTKFSHYLLNADKRYRVKAKLGIRTDTSDSDGNIIFQTAVKVTTEDILSCLAHFRGDIMQVPTMFSALKHEGRPLYEYARKGIVIERKARPITIYGNQFCFFDADILELDIHCSKGTYIRTIIDDLGEMLGCGAHVIELRRLQVASYPTDRMVSLEQLENSPRGQLNDHLLPIDSPIQEYPIYSLSKNESRDVLLGRSISYNPKLIELAQNTLLYRLYYQHQFIGMAEFVENRMCLNPKRLISDEHLLTEINTD